MRYRRELDGLRAIAVIPVVLLHAGFYERRARRILYQQLYEVVANDPYYQYLVLAHLFAASELTPEAIRATVTY